MIRLISFLLAVAALPLLADPPQPVVVDAVTDRYRPLQFDQEKLAGLFAKRMRANSEGYLEHARDSAPTATRAALTDQLGRILEADANAYEYRHDEQLKASMQRLEKLVITKQPPDESTGGGEANQGLLAQKYDLLGLLAYYRVTQSEEALDAATKMGAALFKISSKAPAQQRTPLVIEPLINLYRYTEDNRYLELCKSVADAWLQSKERHNDPTAENLSNLQGLVELYRTTGDESYFRPVPQAWMQIRNSSLSLTGNPLSNEGESAADGNSTGDACTALAWMRLTLNLLRLTGEPQYAEQLEHTIYNQLFATQDSNTGAILSVAPLNGSKHSVPNADACAASEAQSLTLIPAAVWGRYGNGIAVLLYSPGRATIQLRRRGTVQLYSEGTFPENGEFLLHVEPGHNLRFPLRLRVPAWTNNFTVDIGGSHLFGKPGEFLTLNREWKPGDTVKISINMTVRLLVGTGENAGEIAVQRGPQVMALSRVFNPQLKDLAEAAILAADASRPELVPVGGKGPANWPGDQAYTITGEYEGKRQELVLVPFSDAKTCRVWMKKPSGSSGATD